MEAGEEFNYSILLSVLDVSMLISPQGDLPCSLPASLQLPQEALKSSSSFMSPHYKYFTLGFYDFYLVIVKWTGAQDL